MTNVALHMPSIHSLDFISGVGGMTITTWIVVLITVNLSLQAIIQISLGAKDVRTERLHHRRPHYAPRRLPLRAPGRHRR